MVNRVPKGVSKYVQNAVKLIKGLEGSKKKIDSQVEYAQLQELLNQTTGEKNRNYIQGLMVEYDKNISKADVEKTDKEHFKNNISKEARKNIDKLFDREPFSSMAANSNIRARVKDFYMNGGYAKLSDEEKTYFNNMARKIFLAVDVDEELNRPETISYVNLNKEELKKLDEKADVVRSLLKGDGTITNSGFTVKAEQEYIANVIMNDINSDNVFEFLKSYNYNGYSDGEGLFEQLVTEYNFPDKGKLIEKLSTDLKEHMKKYRYDNADSVRIIKAEDAKYNVWNSITDLGGKSGRSNGGYYAVQLDKLVKEEILLRREHRSFDNYVNAKEFNIE